MTGLGPKPRRRRAYVDVTHATSEALPHPHLVEAIERSGYHVLGRFTVEDDESMEERVAAYRDEDRAVALAFLSRVPRVMLVANDGSAFAAVDEWYGDPMVRFRTELSDGGSIETLIQITERGSGADGPTEVSPGESILVLAAPRVPDPAAVHAQHRATRTSSPIAHVSMEQALELWSSTVELHRQNASRERAASWGALALAIPAVAALLFAPIAWLLTRWHDPPSAGAVGAILVVVALAWATATATLSVGLARGVTRMRFYKKRRD